MKNKKQSIINPYTGNRLELKSFKGKKLTWKESEVDRAYADNLSDDEYYDFWEDDRLYVDHEVNRYE